MPPSSALSLPVSAAPARRLSRANRPRKRKSFAEQLSFYAPVAFANMMHKTDGSYVNRPFLYSKQNVRESIFSQINHLSRSVFCFFSSRKEIVPPLPFLSRKKKRSVCAGSAGPQTDGRRHILRCRRSEYRSGYASLLRLVSARVRRACASAFPRKPTTQKKVECGKAFFLRSCCFRQRATQNGRFVCEPSVFILQAECAGKHLFSDKPSIPQCLLFLFFKKRNRPPFLFFLERKENVPLLRKRLSKKSSA